MGSIMKHSPAARHDLRAEPGVKSGRGSTRFTLFIYDVFLFRSDLFLFFSFCLGGNFYIFFIGERGGAVLLRE